MRTASLAVRRLEGKNRAAENIWGVEVNQVRDYAALTYPEVCALNRERTLFLWSVSPLEVHGPHLPLGTDVLVAEELRSRYAAALSERYPELELVALPPCYAGSDPLPFPGSIEIPATVLERLLLATAKGLAAQGFRYLLISDNHGGPRHQMAIEAAARQAWSKYRFHLIDPFGEVFRMMVRHDPDFLRVTGLAPGRCGDDPDVHAGTNETSLMLATRAEAVHADYRGLPPSCPPARSAARTLLGVLADVVRACGCLEAAQDLRHLGETLAWTGDRAKLPYMGAPALATVQAGEAMYRGHVWAMLPLVERALRDEPPRIRPVLWNLRFLRKI